LSPRDIFGDAYELFYAFAYFQAGRFAEAAAAAHQAIQQRPGHPVLYIMAAASYSLADETDKAKRAVTQLTNLVPNIFWLRASRRPFSIAFRKIGAGWPRVCVPQGWRRRITTGAAGSGRPTHEQQIKNHLYQPAGQSIGTEPVV
jgi:tetratricopeptide (TPR) repeat protein